MILDLFSFFCYLYYTKNLFKFIYNFTDQNKIQNKFIKQLFFKKKLISITDKPIDKVFLPIEKNYPQIMYNHTHDHENRHHSAGYIDKSSKVDKESFDVSLVTKNIFIGDKYISLNRVYLKKLNIKHILVAGEELEMKFPDQFNYLKIQIKDSIKANLVQNLSKTNDFIQSAMQKNQNVLIHCAFGVSRSSAFLVGYLIYRYKMSFQQALHFAKQRRPQIKPNQGFRHQLKLYSQDLNKK